jgi:hypothetical protein
MNNELENIWKETGVTYFKILAQHLPGETKENNVSSISIALDYGLDDHGSRVRFLVGTGNFSLHHSIQNGSGAHPASYPMGTRCSFHGG